MPVPPPAGAKKVFEGLMATVYQWPQKLYDGNTRTFECYVRRDTTGIIAFLDRDTVLLAKQEQPHYDAPFWDVPGGQVDAGEDMEAGMIRELLEETGYQAKRMKLWTKRAYKGMTRFEEGIYIGTDLLLDPRGKHEDDSERIELIPTKWKEAVALCLQGKLRRPEVMLAILGMEFDPAQRAKRDAFLSDVS